MLAYDPDPLKRWEKRNGMNGLAVFRTLALCLGLSVTAAFAQSNKQANSQSTQQSTHKDKEHGEAGVFVDYTKLQFAKVNMIGVGGRAAWNLAPNLALEGESAYDFQTSTTQTIINLGAVNVFNSNVRLIHGYAGPEIHFDKGRFRFLAGVKAGVINFGISGPAVAGPFANQLGILRDGETRAVLYPAVAFETKLGPIRTRLDVGDEIFFDKGANHNIKVGAGPVFRF
jgi:hypothetical protein